MSWAYFVLGILTWELSKMLALTINRMIIEHRQKKFIKLVNVRFPYRRDITLISVDSSDKRAMKKIERELREQHGLEVGEDENPPSSLRSTTRLFHNSSQNDKRNG